MSHFPIKIDFQHLGNAKTKALFRQFNTEGTEDINEWREIFVNCLDPEEYRGAVALLGSWSDWKKFKSQWKYFTRYILPEWMDEIEIRLRSEGVRSLLIQATDGTKPSSAAAKFLAEAGFKPKKRGRPTKAEVEHAAKLEAKFDSMWAEDLDRVNNAE